MDFCGDDFFEEEGDGTGLWVAELLEFVLSLAEALLTAAFSAL